MPKLDLDSLKSKLPESLWGLVENDLTSWAAEIEPTLEQPNEYEPYKEAVTGLTPEQLIQARKFAEWYERDQEGFIAQIAQHMGYDLQKPGSNPGNDPDDDDDEDDENMKNLPPALKRQLEDLTKLVTQQGTFLTEQANTAKVNKQNEEFQAYLGTLRETNKEIWNDKVERFVVARLASGDTAENALKDLKELIPAKVEAPTPTPGTDPLAMLNQQLDTGGQQVDNGAPTVIGAGDLPSNRRSITDLSDNETTDLVASIAKRFQEQGA